MSTLVTDQAVSMTRSTAHVGHSIHVFFFVLAALVVKGATVKSRPRTQGHAMCMYIHPVLMGENCALSLHGIRSVTTHDVTLEKQPTTTPVNPTKG